MVKQPYEMKASEWQSKVLKAKETIRGNGVPERLTKGTASSMVSAQKELDFLYFGVKDDLNKKLKCLQIGEITLSAFAQLRMQVELERPVRHSDVIKKARRMGLLKV
ncbi:hypothetical protein [Vibrio vulnificus]|uniref:hypothetical protein n=1 Tax=Vibrio vulnificus TaxID=672 RepID=UPI00215BBF95|nr:hypothetical protein [Vibrio vulnificus]MCR9501885.1 hypothetical protein [Vibrio vulnificus]